MKDNKQPPPPCPEVTRRAQREANAATKDAQRQIGERDTYEELAYRRARRAKMKEEGRSFDPYLFFKPNPLMPPSGIDKALNWSMGGFVLFLIMIAIFGE